MQVRHAELDQRHVGWVSAWVASPSARFVRIDLRGPDNTLRVRQLKLLAESEQHHPHGGGGGGSADRSSVIQRRECEAETLSVFRLLTSLVFGRLVSEGGEPAAAAETEEEHRGESLAEDVDLKEHMVGILFSHTTELTKLQRQVGVVWNKLKVKKVK